MKETENPEITPSIEGDDSGLMRYAGYAARLKTIALSVKRYVAYSSDFGEAFRPLTNPNFVRGAYAVSWAYISYDVAAEGRRAHLMGHDNAQVGQAVIKRAVFQSIASMLLPSITIHSQVRLFSYICGRIGRFQKWGPTIAGLAAMPALPFLFDHPVERAVDTVFDRIFEAVETKKKAD